MSDGKRYIIVMRDEPNDYDPGYYRSPADYPTRRNNTIVNPFIFASKAQAQFIKDEEDKEGYYHNLYTLIEEAQEHGF